jgi:hypothetical protein
MFCSSVGTDTRSLGEKSMILAKRWTALGIAMGMAATAGMAGRAQANEVTYDEIAGGTVTITATDVTNPSVIIGLSGNTLALTTGSPTNVGFDATGLSLDSFVFTTSGTITVTSPTAYAGTTINFSSLSLTSTGVTPVTNIGGGDYQFTGAGALASGMFSVNGKPAVTVNGGTTTGLGGTVGIGGTPDTLGVDGITLGTIVVGGQTISLKADIAFNGAAVVPLPATAWLFTSGLGLLGLPLLRRRIVTSA